jgi:hypothetical protein
LCFPLTVLLAAYALRRAQPAWIVGVLAVAGLVWPVAHIANIAWLAVLVNAALVKALGALAVRTDRRVPAHAAA